VIVAGLSVGSTDVPGCPGLKVGIESPVALGTGVAAGGAVSIDRFIPGSFSGRTIQVQSVDRTNCSVGTLNTFDLQ